MTKMKAPYFYKGVATRYLVYDDGRVFDSINNHMMTPYQNPAGYQYLRIELEDTKEKVLRGIHQLVAETFLPNPEKKPYVNHKDGIKTNNHVSNLEWATASENNYHAYANKLRIPRMGEKVHFAVHADKLVEQACELLSQNVAPLKVEEITGIPAKTLYEIRAKKIWKHIANKYEFPIYKYPRALDYEPEFRDKIEERLLQDALPRDVMREFGIPFDDKKMYKRIRDWKYRLMKAQRLNETEPSSEVE